jgi:hypothetical protein
MMARHASKVRRTVMRFLPSSVNALFRFHEIAFLAVAIETFLPQRVEREQDLPPIAGL